jgi:polysaccharide pyruvyl transferase WcaK-like protein
MKEENQKVIGLYYDPKAKELQELIELNMFELTPLSNIDEEDLKKMAEMSILNDPEIIRHLVNVLASEHDSAQPSSQNNKILL